MANIQIFQQANNIPKKGGTFGYLITSDVDLKWTQTTMAVTGGLSYVEDYANRRFSITFPSNSTGSQRTYRCALKFILQDNSEQTISFDIIQDSSDNYAYFSTISQSTYSEAEGGIRGITLNTNQSSHSN